MSAPRAARATALRVYFVLNHRLQLPGRNTAGAFCFPGFQCNEDRRYFSSKPTDNPDECISEIPGESDNRRHNVKSSRQVADDFFGIEENLEHFEKPVKAKEENVTLTVADTSGETSAEGGIVLGQERVLGLRFGHIRRDFDNPALPRSRQTRNKILSSNPTHSENMSESADFLSKLLHSDKHGSVEKRPFQTQDNSSKKSNHLRTENVKNGVHYTVGHGTTLKSFGSQGGVTEANFVDRQYFDEKYFNKGNGGIKNADLSLRHEDSEIVDASFKVDIQAGQTTEQIKESGSRKQSLSDIKNETESLNFIDGQYFEPMNASELVESQKNNTSDIGISMPRLETPAARQVDDNSDINYVDDQYFGMKSDSSAKENVILENKIRKFDLDAAPETAPQTDLPYREFSRKESDEKSSTSVMKEPREGSLHHTLHASFMPESQTYDSKPDDIVVNKATTLSKKLSKKLKPNLVNPQSAYDMAMKIRMENAGKISAIQDKDERGIPKVRFGKKLDSQGFRILKDQVPDWTYTSREILAKVLRDSIIYDDNDIVAIDKPYGLPSHGGPGVAASIGQLTPLLAQLLDKSGKLENLHLIHRLDKETTGVMVLARTSQKAFQLKELFRKRQVIKKYWLLTKGVPNPTEGIIDIPIGESTSQKIYMMCLRPEPSEETKTYVKKSNMKSYEAVTEYRVLSCHEQCALVECRPITGVKHQVRVHMARGLNTPILGDHKYSHFNKLAPQKLYPEILHRLAIRQSKVRHLAMHLHAKVLVIPEFLDGRNLVLTARLPGHFKANMRKLKLKPSSK